MGDLLASNTAHLHIALSQTTSGAISNSAKGSSIRNEGISDTDRMEFTVLLQSNGLGKFSGAGGLLAAQGIESSTELAGWNNYE